MLNTLHSVKHILNEEEYTSVGKTRGRWLEELAVVIATKPPGAVQETLGVLEEYLYGRAAKGIKSKLCLCISLCRHTSPHF